MSVSVCVHMSVNIHGEVSMHVQVCVHAQVYASMCLVCVVFEVRVVLAWF